MNFFDDDFKFDNSPLPNLTKGSQKKLQTKKSIKVEDELDDIFVQLLDKEKKKNSRKEIPSFTSLENIQKPFSPTKPQNTQPQKWQSFDSIKLTNVGNQKNYEPLRDRKTSKSIYDEKGSQDGKSFKSGATGKVHFTGDLLDFPKTQQNVHFQSVNDLPVGSMRSMMNPPLRKRAQSKAESDAGEDFLQTRRFPDQNFTSIAEIDSFNPTRPPLPKKDPSPPKIQSSIQNFQKTTTLPKVQQKIVYIKQENKTLKQEYEKQLKIIKQIHNKQIQRLCQDLQKQRKQLKQIKLKLLKQYQQQIQKQRNIQQNIYKRQNQKIKQLYQWEIKRKTQSYQIEIERLKKLGEINLQNKFNQNQSQRLTQLQRQKLILKQKDLQLKIRRVQQKQKYLKQKQKNLQTRQSQFQKYHKKQQQKLTQKTKQLYRLQNQYQTKKLTHRKQQQQQKINISNQLSKQQFILIKQKQQLKLQQKQLEINRQLFQKQKIQYQQFNQNIMKDYKKKLKELQQEKFYCQEKQIQLYKKIHTVEIVTGLKEQAKKFKNQPNIENLDKINKIQGEKLNRLPIKTDESQIPIGHTFGPSHSPSPDKIKVQNPSMNLNVSNSNLREYLLKINKDNKRMRPF